MRFDLIWTSVAVRVRVRVWEVVTRGEGEEERMVEEWMGDRSSHRGGCSGVSGGGHESRTLFCQGTTEGSMGDEAVLPAKENMDNKIE